MNIISNDISGEKILVTGGCGFIGSNFINYLMSLSKNLQITVVDSLTYAGNLTNISLHLDNPNFIFFNCDITNRKKIYEIVSDGNFTAIFNFAAESHVDRSIKSPDKFFKTNVGGTLNLLQAALEYKVNRFVQISTDEVYGSLSEQGYFTEETPLDPRSPYSASKASADTFVQAFFHTYGLDTIITRCSNNYGPYQFPEKLIPLMINNILTDKDLPVYGKGDNVRDWIHVEDHCIGIWAAYEKGDAGQIYNFGGEEELSNLELVEKLLSNFSNSKSRIKFVDDRLGHDFRYAMDITKVKSCLGWTPSHNFADGLKNTIKWYVENQDWLRSITSGEYMKYYSENYG